MHRANKKAALTSPPAGRALDLSDLTPLTAMQKVAANDAADRVAEVVAKWKCGVNRSISGQWPLTIAVKAGATGVVSELLTNYGADPNAPTAEEHPLRVAVMKENADMVRALIQAGADRSVVDDMRVSSEDMVLALRRSSAPPPPHAPPSPDASGAGAVPAPPRRKAAATAAAVAVPVAAAAEKKRTARASEVAEDAASSRPAAKGAKLASAAGTSLASLTSPGTKRRRYDNAEEAAAARPRRAAKEAEEEEEEEEALDEEDDVDFQPPIPVVKDATKRRRSAVPAAAGVNASKVVHSASVSKVAVTPRLEATAGAGAPRHVASTLSPT
ncbi:ankyrin repeat domain-containing protein, partial [archaeon]